MRRSSPFLPTNVYYAENSTKVRYRWVNTSLVKVFFYGSFMDLEVLRTLGVVPRTFETAELKNWNITFSPMATLVRSKGDSVYGIIAELSRAEVRTLYSRRIFLHAEGLESAKKFYLGLAL